MSNVNATTNKPVPSCHLAADELECIRNDELIFEGVSLKVSAGEILQVDGPNGSGKSCLLRILCGLLQQSEGTVAWCGTDIQSSLGYAEYRERLAYVGHQGGVTAELTPVENLEIAMALGNARDHGDPVAALHDVQLRGVELVSARYLSAGQRQRVALARLRLLEADVWILDEPFNAIDQQGKVMIEHIIAEHARRGGITILATHQPVNVSDYPISQILMGEWNDVDN